MTLISGWIRYAGTATSLSSQSAYALLIFGQVISLPLTPPHSPSFSTPKMFSAFAQPIFQVLGPMYSERWFDLKGRTTATMMIAIGPSLPPPTLAFSISSLYSQSDRRRNWPVARSPRRYCPPVCQSLLYPSFYLLPILIILPSPQVLVLAIISTAATPAVFFITDAPPTPPSKPKSHPIP